MIHIHHLLSAFLFLFILGSPAQAALEVPVSETSHPLGAVVLVVDGLGSSYVYPEMRAFSLEGEPLGRANLFNLTSSGARVLDVRAPVPVTEPGHDVLVTGFASATSRDLSWEGATIFDLAQDRGYLCLALLQRGDHMEMLQKQDALIHFQDNSLSGTALTEGYRASLPPETIRALQPLMEGLLLTYRPFSSLSPRKGAAGYAAYNSWALEGAAYLAEHLTVPFLLLVNVGGVDSAGHNLGPQGYLETVAALDEGLGVLSRVCRERGLLLIITADHGMAFSRGRGAHASGSYALAPESLRIPLVLQGPGVDDLLLAGVHSQADVAPTLLSLMGIPGTPSLADGTTLPLKQGYDLVVNLSVPGDVRLTGASLDVKGKADRDYQFTGVPRGLYRLSYPGGYREVVVSGDARVDLTGSGATGRGQGSRTMETSVQDGEIGSIKLREEDVPGDAGADPGTKAANRRPIAVLFILGVNVLGGLAILRVIRGKSLF